MTGKRTVTYRGTNTIGNTEFGPTTKLYDMSLFRSLFLPLILMNVTVSSWITSVPRANRFHGKCSHGKDDLCLPSNEYPSIDSYESAWEVLTVYHAIHGNLAIPRKFQVPAIQDYPMEWHGIRLAHHIYNMRWWQRHIANRSDRVAQLNKIHFIWGRLQPEWNIFMEGMLHYHTIHGEALVPYSFVIPHDEKWPKACWGFPLGNVAYRVRFRQDFLGRQDTAPSRRAQLDGLGFVWNVGEHKFLMFLRALKHFARLEKKSIVNVNPTSSRERFLRVSSKFVVPSGHENGWPESLWSYQLGAKCMAVRQKGLYVKNHPDRRRKLEEIGFLFNGNSALGWLDVIHAAAIYSQIHGRHLNVPLDFVVPHPPEGKFFDGIHSGDTSESWPWPKHLWGLKLGQRLKDVRLKGAYLKGQDARIRRAQLDNLGFVWNQQKGRRKRALGLATGKE